MTFGEPPSSGGNGDSRVLNLISVYLPRMLRPVSLSPRLSCASRGGSLALLSRADGGWWQHHPLPILRHWALGLPPSVSSLPPSGPAPSRCRPWMGWARGPSSFTRPRSVPTGWGRCRPTSVIWCCKTWVWRRSPSLCLLFGPWKQSQLFVS